MIIAEQQFRRLIAAEALAIVSVSGNRDLRKAIKIFSIGFVLHECGDEFYDLNKVDITLTAIKALENWLRVSRSIHRYEVAEAGILESIILKGFNRRSEEMFEELEIRLEELCLAKKKKMRSENNSLVTHLRAS